jgi:hypothetical protein
MLMLGAQRLTHVEARARLFARAATALCAAALAVAAPAQQPQRPQLTLGWIGQSNMQGVCDRATMHKHVLPSDAALRARLSYYQVDVNQYTDSAGQLRPMAFEGWPTAAARIDGYDYQPNLLPDLYGTGNGSFGPDLMASYVIGASLSRRVVNVKLAVGGTYLTTQPPSASVNFRHSGAYLWLNSFDSFDTSLPWGGNDDGYLADTVAVGTVTSATSFRSGAATLRDAEQQWTPNQWAGHWAVADRCIGLILGNSADTLSVLSWAPTFSSAPKPLTTYAIQKRTRRAVSLAKTFIEGYCARTKELLALEHKTMDMRVVGVQLGESDAQTQGNAAKAGARMTALIAWLRKELHARGYTTVARQKIGIVLGLIKEDDTWPYAPLVNNAYRNIARTDPYVEVSPVSSLALGGRAPIPGSPSFDFVHYSADAQVENGRNFALRIRRLLDKQ